MDLFGSENDNLLPFDGTALYHGLFLSAAEADRFFDRLLETIAWQSDEVIVFGKRHITQRKVAWYGDESYAYTYSGTTREALPWTPELLELKQQVEERTGSVYNSCLLNRYHSGEEGMGWHSDDEKMLQPNGSIASVSLGAERKFAFKHKRTGETVSLLLDHGSLLEMKGETQRYWLHSLPKTKKVKRERINLTFRIISR
jgi:alkylated DNA repair dioxygenase AlkB